MNMLSVFALLLPLVSIANAGRGGGNGADCSADSTVCANGLVCCPDEDTCKPQPKCFPDCVSNGGDIETISDGSCTGENNIEACGYDGGDCCVCDCEDSDETTCGSDGYDCQDPDSECNYSDCDGVVSWIQDGWCDLGNMSDECGYDGGDCCECDCLDGLTFPCEYVGYDCQDPTSECTDVTTVDTSTGDDGDDGKKNGVGAACDTDPTGCPNGLVCCEGLGNICAPKPKCDDDN